MTARKPDDPYTVVEFARKQRISLSTARKGVKNGTIPSYKVGRQYRIPASAVNEMRGGTAEAPPVPYTGDLDAYIRELVVAAPKLTARQRNNLSAIFGGAR